jgi:hypothetical protein
MIDRKDLLKRIAPKIKNYGFFDWSFLVYSYQNSVLPSASIKKSMFWDLMKAINEHANIDPFQGKGNAAERRVTEIYGMACDGCGVRSKDAREFGHSWYCGEQY